jgi:DNA ligase-1
MNRFAELLDRLTYEPARNAKLRLMTDYFRSTPDPERGWALAALTGGLSFPHAKPGLIRNLIAERTDPVLFELSYDYVGDLSETVALMWPVTPSPLVGEGWSGGPHGDRRCSHPPSLSLPHKGGGNDLASTGGDILHRCVGV